MSASSETGEKRLILSKERSGITVTEILIVAVLIASGAVLKAVSNTMFAFTPLKPNMVIAMYVLAILLIRPKVLEALAVGLIAGVVCMFLPGATPYANIASEAVGAVTAALLIMAAYRFADKKNLLLPAAITFFATLASGYTFFLMLKVLLLSGMDVRNMAIGIFNAIILGTAAANSAIVFILYPALSKIIGKKTYDSDK